MQQTFRTQDSAEGKGLVSDRNVAARNVSFKNLATAAGQDGLSVGKSQALNPVSQRLGLAEPMNRGDSFAEGLQQIATGSKVGEEQCNLADEDSVMGLIRGDAETASLKVGSMRDFVESVAPA